MLVSILIPCFNAERWIAQCIESALAQTWPEKEVIVVDDGSTDDSPDIIQSFDDRIRFEAGPNRGGNAARNRLLDLSAGAWLQYLDADDYLLPGKVEGQMKLVAANPNVDVVYAPALLESWGNDNSPSPLQAFPLPPPHDPWVHLGRWRLPQTGGTLWRKGAIERAGRWNERLACCQEHELYLRLLETGSVFLHSTESAAVYRYWPGETVSRRNPVMVMRQRLEILDRVLAVLAEKGWSTPARVNAVNLTRFETARSLWPLDHEEALKIVESIRRTGGSFRPDGPAAGWLYQLAYLMLGFPFAERVAGVVRRGKTRILEGWHAT